MEHRQAGPDGATGADGAVGALGVRHPRGHRLIGHHRLLLAAAAGILTAGLTMLGGASVVLAVMTGWIVLAGLFLAWSGAALLRLDAAGTRRSAVGQDPGRIGVDAVILGACAVSLIGVGRCSSTAESVPAPESWRCSGCSR